MGVNPFSHRVDRGSYSSSIRISRSDHSGSSSSSSSRRALLLLLISAPAWAPTAAFRHHGSKLHSAAAPRVPISAGSSAKGWLSRLPAAAMAAMRRSEMSHRHLGKDVPQGWRRPSRGSRCERLVLMLRGGKEAEGDWTTSTPDDDELGKWSRGSSVADDGLDEDDEESLHNIPDGLDEQSSPLSEQSTGLGIHQTNWSRIDEIGLPVYDLPEFASVAGEARVLKRAQAAAEGGVEWRERERERIKEESRVRSDTVREAIQEGMLDEHEAAVEMKGASACSKCKKVLCFCEFLEEEKKMRKRGIEDPFARVKESHILQPGQDVLPSSSTPDEEIEFWNKVTMHGEEETSGDEDIKGVNMGDVGETCKKIGYKYLPDGLTADQRAAEMRKKERAENRRALKDKERVAAEWLKDGDGDDDTIVIRRDVGGSEEASEEGGMRGRGGEEGSLDHDKEAMLESSTPQETSEGEDGIRSFKSNQVYSESEGEGGGEEGEGVDGESAEDAAGLEEAMSRSRQGTPLSAKGERSRGWGRNRADGISTSTSSSASSDDVGVAVGRGRTDSDVRTFAKQKVPSDIVKGEGGGSTWDALRHVIDDSDDDDDDDVGGGDDDDASLRVGDAKRRNDDAILRVGDAKRRKGANVAGNQIDSSLGRLGLAGAGAKLDLDSDSSMDDEVFRKRQKQRWAEEERKEQEIAAFGTTARVHMGKDDKRGTRISTSEMDPFMQEMIDDTRAARRRRRAPLRGEEEEEDL